MSGSPSSHPGPEGAVPAAAILEDGSADVDAFLADVARRQRAAGRRVRGLVMTRLQGGGGCADAMVLVDLYTGDDYLVSQPMGALSTSCRADPQGFARASRVLRRALDEAPDLVICNRFGGLEAEGRGFRDELLQILLHGIPLLTSVATRHVDAWERATGGATLLPAQPAAVNAWLDRVVRSAETGRIDRIPHA